MLVNALPLPPPPPNTQHTLWARYFHGRPAAFGPALPARGLAGRLVVAGPDHYACDPTNLTQAPPLLLDPGANQSSASAAADAATVGPRSPAGAAPDCEARGLADRGVKGVFGPLGHLLTSLYGVP